MKVVRNAGRDSAKFELQVDNGAVVNVFDTREAAEAAMNGEVVEEAPAPVVEPEEDTTFEV